MRSALWASYSVMVTVQHLIESLMNDDLSKSAVIRWRNCQSLFLTVGNLQIAASHIECGYETHLPRLSNSFAGAVSSSSSWWEYSERQRYPWVWSNSRTDLPNGQQPVKWSWGNLRDIYTSSVNIVTICFWKSFFLFDSANNILFVSGTSYTID